jgi:copper(I)-binding protein
MKALLAGIAALLPAGSAAAIEISQGWTVANERKGAEVPLYMTITNPSAEPDALMRVSCPELAFFAIKRATDKGGEGPPKAREVRQIPVPAGQATVLGPGGFHVWLRQTKEPLAEGATYVCSVSFQKGGTKELPVRVEAAGRDAVPAH